MRILFLTQVLPFPLDAGPKVRAHYVLRYLAEAGHEVTLLSFVRGTDSAEAVARLRRDARRQRAVHHQRHRGGRGHRRSIDDIVINGVIVAPGAFARLRLAADLASRHASRLTALCEGVEPGAEEEAGAKERSGSQQQGNEPDVQGFIINTGSILLKIRDYQDAPSCFDNQNDDRQIGGRGIRHSINHDYDKSQEGCQGYKQVMILSPAGNDS